MNENTDKESLEILKNAIISMSIESWRFSKTYNKMLTKLDAGDQSKYLSQFRWFMKKMDEALQSVDFWVVNVEGNAYDPGIAATALNINEYDIDDTLYVDQMVEPIIMGKEGLIRTGTITVRKVEYI